MEKNKKSTITEDNSINRALTKNLKVHTNLAQDIVVTTEDKIRICLMNYLNKIERKGKWIAPIGILLTIIITLLTTTFKYFIFNADTWIAIFVIGMILSIIWLIFSIRDAFISLKIDDIIEELKKSSPLDKNQILQNTIKEEEKFNIVKAWYGIINNNIDVTFRLNGMVKNGKLITEATNSLVDKDPVPGVPKFLKIEYEYDGENKAVEFKENDIVELP